MKLTWVIILACMAGLGAVGVLLLRHGSSGSNHQEAFETLRQLGTKNDFQTILAEVLDPDQPEVRKVLADARGFGPTRAMLQLRRAHEKMPRPHYLHHGDFIPDELKNGSAALAYAKRGFTVHQRPLWPLEFPIAWNADPFQDRAWRYQLNSWSFLEPLLRAYCNTGHRECLNYSREVALDWLNAHADSDNDNPFAWYDMAIGHRAKRLAFVTDQALRDRDISPHDKVRLLWGCRLHALQLADPDKLASHSNQGLHQLAGLLALADSVPELRDAKLHQSYATTRLRKLVCRHFNLTEGVYLEHSPAYQVSVLNLLAALLETGWLGPEQGRLQAIVDRASRSLLWMIHPSGALARLGDTNFESARTTLYRAECPQLQYVLSEGETGQAPEESFAVFPGSGYAVFRSPWTDRPWVQASYLILAAGFHSRMHKHADDLTFEWSECGQPLLVDSGKFKYHYDDPGRQYVESTRAHNTVEINGQDYSRNLPDAFGSALKEWGRNDGVYFVEAAIDRSRIGVHQRRVLVFKPGQWLVVIDRLSSNRTNTYTQWFHLHPKLSVSPMENGILVPIPGATRNLLIAPLGANPHMTQRVVKGQKHPRLQGWTSLKTNQMVPNYAIGFTVKGQTANLVTLFQLTEHPSPSSDLDANVSVSDDCVHVYWNAGQQEHGFRYVWTGKRQLTLKADANQ